MVSENTIFRSKIQFLFQFSIFHSHAKNHPAEANSHRPPPPPSSVCNQVVEDSPAEQVLSSGRRIIWIADNPDNWFTTYGNIPERFQNRLTFFNRAVFIFSIRRARILSRVILLLCFFFFLLFFLAMRSQNPRNARNRRHGSSIHLTFLQKFLPYFPREDTRILLQKKL